MDGLLVDSEILWHEAEVELLVPLGAPIDAGAARTTKGMFVTEVVAHYHALAPWPSPSVDAVAQQILDRVGELVEERGTLLPGATAAISLCESLGPIAVASSTPMSLIVRTLSHFGLLERFEVIHSAEDEPRGKPDPGVFLTTASRLGVEPARCLVFEDSAAGVLAASKAQMGCVAVPSRDELHDPAFSTATIVLASLDELDEVWLRARLGRSMPATGTGTAQRG